MTINVTVRVWELADWTAEVIAQDYALPRVEGAEPVSSTVQKIVYPGESFEACATDCRDIIVRERKLVKVAIS